MLGNHDLGHVTHVPQFAEENTILDKKQRTFTVVAKE